MACPLFLPASPLTGFAPEALPLGNLFAGQCAAQAGTLIPTDTLRRCCNTGYARGCCEHAAGQQADANRFLIKSYGDGTVEIAWSTERDHHPVAVGTLRLTDASSAPESPLERQARACVSAYLHGSTA
jgi:hypothetical protein